jgi:Flp pilus assembly pilin Flp
MRSIFRRLWHQQSGQDIPEYALLVALIAVGILAAIYAYGLANSNTFGGATDGISAAAPSSAQSGGGGGGTSGGGSGSSGQRGGGSGGQGGSADGGSGDGGSSGGQGGSGNGGQGGSAGQLPSNPTPIGQPHQGSGGSQ